MMMTLFFGLTTNAAVTSVKITSPTSYASMRIARKSTDRNVQIKATVNTTGGSLSLIHILFSSELCL